MRWSPQPERTPPSDFSCKPRMVPLVLYLRARRQRGGVAWDQL